MIRRVNNAGFAPYWLWECWQAGFYQLTVPEQHAAADAAAALLADQDEFADAVHRVFGEWPISTAVHLTDPRRKNYAAWVGQAACCLELQVPAIATRQGWHQMRQHEQEAANATAWQLVSKWKRSWKGHHAQTLFD